MSDNSEKLLRYVVPGVVLVVAFLPLLFFSDSLTARAQYVIKTLPGEAFAEAGFLFGSIVAIGTLLQFVIKRELENAIDQCWTKPLARTWSDELENWCTKSPLFPGARLGFRIRRVRWLLSQDENLAPLALRLRSGEARGLIDVSTYVTNRQLKHLKRLGYVYAEASVAVTGGLAALIYGLACAVLVCRGEYSARSACALGLALLSLLLGRAARTMAATEIDRVEFIQHGFALRADDSDLKTVANLLRQLRADLRTSMKGGVIEPDRVGLAIEPRSDESFRVSKGAH